MRILVTACFILSILFFLETVARAQAVTFNGFQSNVPATGLAGPWSTAVDASGDVYIADSNNARVVEVTPGGVQTTVPATVANPVAAAVDGAGDVYIADVGLQSVVEVTPGGVQTTVPTTGLTAPEGVAVDSAGNVYIAGVTVDSAGNIYASSYGNNTVPELSQSVNFGSIAVGSPGTSNQQSLVYTFQSAD